MKKYFKSTFANDKVIRHATFLRVKTTSAKSGKQSGMTLIEVIMVVAIIGIMAAIAVPSYTGFTLKQRRADAHHLLNRNAHQLQRCLTLVGAYDGTCNVLATSAEGHYTLEPTLSTRTAQTWSLTAVANGKQQSDTDCASISLNHTGQKSATGDLPDSCW